MAKSPKNLIPTGEYKGYELLSWVRPSGAVDTFVRLSDGKVSKGFATVGAAMDLVDSLEGRVDG
jgi:hypothetical protein